MNREQSRTLAMYVGGAAVGCVVIGAVASYLYHFGMISLSAEQGGLFANMIVVGFFIFLGAVFYLSWFNKKTK